RYKIGAFLRIIVVLQPNSATVMNVVIRCRHRRKLTGVADALVGTKHLRLEINLLDEPLAQMLCPAPIAGTGPNVRVLCPVLHGAAESCSLSGYHTMKPGLVIRKHSRQVVVVQPLLHDL